MLPGRYIEQLIGVVVSGHSLDDREHRQERGGEAQPVAGHGAAERVRRPARRGPAAACVLDTQYIY